MNATTRKAARPDWTRISPSAAIEETAIKIGHPFLKRAHLVTHDWEHLEDLLTR